MQKAIIIIALFTTAGFMSCKKSYTCMCTTTVVFAGRTPDKSESAEPIGHKTSEKQATAICNATQAQLNDHFAQQLKDPNVPSTSSAECALQ